MPAVQCNSIANFRYWKVFLLSLTEIYIFLFVVKMNGFYFSVLYK